VAATPIHRIAFFGGKPLSARCLQLLHTMHAHDQLEIVAVCPRPEGDRGWWSGPGVPEVRETARSLGLPVIETPEELAAIPVDLGLSVLYHRILSADVVAHPRCGFLNLHLAPLPHYRGCNACSHAIMNGDTRFGATLHRMDAKPDHGDVIAVRWFDIPPAATARDLMQRAEEEGYRLFCEMLPSILSNAMPARSQQEIIEREGVVSRFYRRDSLSSNGAKRVDLSWPVERILNHVRALDFPPFEPAYAEVAGRKVYLTLKPRG
jgi:methionyl-tRNA formyltransferase